MTGKSASTTSPMIKGKKVVVIGGGQAGLSVGYCLARRDVSFVILDAYPRIGDAWRTRWDSLRLFTPAKYDGLVGLPFPAPAFSFPTKDEMANYLEAYARKFRLPVLTGVSVNRVSRDGARYLVETGSGRWEADHVVVAMATYQAPRVPEFAGSLAPSIRQLHSSAYRNPGQLQPGDVLLVGAANSGADIALDVTGPHRTWLAGRHPGHLRPADRSRRATRIHRRQRPRLRCRDQFAERNHWRNAR